MNLTTGPVEMRPAVIEALASAPIPHRSAAFAALLSDCKACLADLVGAKEVAILSGSGTLANDAIAAHLNGRGLILVNGEFGERLVNHAIGAGLDFEVRRATWGHPLYRGDAQPFDWVWAVHCETSTGVVNDLDGLKDFASRCNARLVLDCVSSIGAVPVNLRGVHLASGVSGKAIGSLSGAALVFASAEVTAARLLPPYLDLSRYWRGNPFTLPSPILAGLKTALDRDWSARFAQVRAGGGLLRDGLRHVGFPSMGNAPHVATIKIAGSTKVADRLALQGVMVSGHSSYLAERGWLQLCLMGEFSPADIDRAVLAIGEVARC